jgi:hypothetical protein
MNFTTRRSHDPPARGWSLPSWLSTDNIWVRRLLNVLVALAVGWLLGEQIREPQSRVIKGLVGIGVLYAAWRFPIPVSLSAFLVLFPFPFPTAYGSSNTIFIFLITAMWLAQIVLRTARPAGRTLLDLPIVILLCAYLLSFNSVSYALALKNGLINLSTIVAGVFVYYLIVSSIRDEATLKRVVRIITIMALLCFGTAVWELTFPGVPVIKGWILASSYYNPVAIERGLRVGGPFQDFELFAEFCATLMPLMIFQFARAEGARARALWAGIVLLNFFTLMATVTRGATIAFVVAMAYMLFHLRRSMKLKDYILTISLAVTVWSGVEFYLSNYTVSGSVVDRLLNTKIVDGMPDSRTFWPEIFARAMEKPWVGHGPYYEFGEHGAEKLRRFFWPHNGYLYYLHTVGLLGTGAFLLILWRTLRRSLQHSAISLTSPDFSRSLLFTLHIMVFTFAFDQLKIEYLRNQHYQFWPWILFGLTVATLNVVQNRPAAGPAAGNDGGLPGVADRKALRRSPLPADNRRMVPGV